VQYLEHPVDVDVAVVDEGLPVVGHLSADVAQVDVADGVPRGELVDGAVVVDAVHLGERADAQLQRVAVARVQVQEAAVEFGPPDEARRSPDDGEGGIVGVRRHLHVGLLRHRKQLLQEPLEAAPQLFRGDLRRRVDTLRSLRVVDHVPHHSLRQRQRIAPVAADRLRPPAGERAADARRHPCEAEVVPHDRDARLSDVADELFEAVHLRDLLRAVEQDVVPEAGVEVLEGFQDEPLLVHHVPDGAQLVVAPDFAVAGHAPAVGVPDGLIVSRDGVLFSVEVVHQVDHQVGAAELLCVTEVLLRQMMTVEDHCEFHASLLPSRL